MGINREIMVTLARDARRTLNWTRVTRRWSCGIGERLFALAGQYHEIGWVLIESASTGL